VSDQTEEFRCLVRKFDEPLAAGTTTSIVIPINYAPTCSFTVVNGDEPITAATIEMAVDYEEDGTTPLWGPAVAEPSLVLAANARVQMNLKDLIVFAMRLRFTVVLAGTVTIVGRGP